MTTCSLIRVGLMPYEEALALQRTLAACRADGRIGDLLLLLEHPPVITLGRAGEQKHLLVPRSSLAALGIAFCESDRGGDMTYHGPGQLVGYPILSLSEHGRDVHRYLRRIEEVVIDTLSAFGIEAGRWSGRTGVWVAGRKIASIGIHVSRWVTCHGFALNVDMDPAPFRLIVPCGIRGAEVTTMAMELGRPVSMDEVVRGLAGRFEAGFGIRLVPSSLAWLAGTVEAGQHDRQTGVAREGPASDRLPPVHVSH